MITVYFDLDALGTGSLFFINDQLKSITNICIVFSPQQAML
jgi:hypothetical protein